MHRLPRGGVVPLLEFGHEVLSAFGDIEDLASCLISLYTASIVRGSVRLPSELTLLSSLPSQSVGDRYDGTPSCSNCSGDATPPSPRVPPNDADTKSGSVSSTTSKDGLLSARRGTFSFSAARFSRTGSVQVAVPTIRSARPSDSRISVDPWLSETARCGGASIVTSRPQFWMVSG